MQYSGIVSVLSYIAILGLSSSFLFLPFIGNGRKASVWLRTVCFAWGIVGWLWSGIAFLLFFFASQLNTTLRTYLSHGKSQLSGIAIGLMISLFLSPEFRRLGSRLSQA